MADSKGNGWRGNIFHLAPASSGVDLYTATLATGASGVATFGCLARDTEYTVTCGGGKGRKEVSWTLFDASGLEVTSGGASKEDKKASTLPVLATLRTET